MCGIMSIVVDVFRIEMIERNELKKACYFDNLDLSCIRINRNVMMSQIGQKQRG